jgi:hypothetical protein
MAFYLLLICGFAGGVLGGMGMGGGTVLIPLLTVVCGISQPVAQGVNLLSFLPMSFPALSVHAKNGLLQKEGLLSLIVPALLFSAAGALVATVLPAALLKRAFGFFLLILSFARFPGIANSLKKCEKFRKKI